MGIEVNIKIRYSSKDHSWLCFKHAVQLAMQGEDIDVDIDDYNSEYYMGSTSCDLCYQKQLEHDGYVYQCTTCGKLFKESKGGTHLVGWDGNIPVRCGPIERIKK